MNQLNRRSSRSESVTTARKVRLSPETTGFGITSRLRMVVALTGGGGSGSKPSHPNARTALERSKCFRRCEVMENFGGDWVPFMASGAIGLDVIFLHKRHLQFRFFVHRGNTDGQLWEGRFRVPGPYCKLRGSVPSKMAATPHSGWQKLTILPLSTTSGLTSTDECRTSL